VRRYQPLFPDRCQERLYADDIHDAREIIGEYVQGHFGRNLRQALHQKMRRAHPHLERAEGMLSRLAAQAQRRGLVALGLKENLKDVTFAVVRATAKMAALIEDSEDPPQPEFREK
jgi:predicted DNA-binding protein YlxM (UPF0122 family)